MPLALRRTVITVAKGALLLSAIVVFTPSPFLIMHSLAMHLTKLHLMLPSMDIRSSAEGLERPAAAPLRQLNMAAAYY